VPDELDEALSRGRPGFVLGGFGGATEGYIKERDVFSRLRNGLSIEENRALADSTNVGELVPRIISQVKLLPLFRESVQSGRLFRILTLDGGGIRGAFTAAVLAKWDDMLKSGGGSQLIKHFDLVAGTSTGAILAIGLGLGLTPLEILNFYRQDGEKIFPKDGWIQRGRPRQLFKSKHKSSVLRSTLEEKFQTRLLKDSCCRLVLPTVRAIHGEAEVIVTPHGQERMAFSNISAVDAALASSAAPTYFDQAVVQHPIAPGIYLDGGVWANNPVLPAIAEAVQYLKVPLDRIDVLSVGTLGHEADFTKSLGKGMAGWARMSVNLFFAAQEQGAAKLANSFLSLARHLRINQPTPTEISLDDVSAIGAMALRGANLGENSFLTVRSRFLDGFHVPDWRHAG
jgi:patatin-like phospholipase/acyl hydrolase